MAPDQTEPGFADTLALAIEEGELPDRRVQAAFMHDLLVFGGGIAVRLAKSSSVACSANSASISG